MRLMALTFLLIFFGVFRSEASIPSSQSTVRGVLEVTSSAQYILHTGGLNSESYEIRPVFHPVVAQLEKLKSGDLLEGIGHIRQRQGEKPIVMLESIDFVGLRKLLGTWMAQSLALINFTNFHQLVVLIPSLKGLEKLNFTYTVGPSEKDGWMIFFHDENHVILGSLRIGGENAKIELLSSDIDLPFQSVELVRVGQ